MEKAIFLMNQLGKEQRPFFFMVDFLENKPLVILLEEMEQSLIQLEMQGVSITKVQHVEKEGDISIFHNGYSHTSYAAQFERVVLDIRRGNSFLVNLTCETPIHLNCGLQEIYNQVRSKYKLLYRDQFMVFSPETFVKIENGIIASFPMKGTIDATLPNAVEIILNNTKEKAEHSTVVDLIRNDLSMVAENVRVSRFRYMEEIITDTGRLLQVSSEIDGDLPDDYCAHIGDILFKLLPAGSVTGAPKSKTVAIIREIETYERGYYTGVFGVFDGKNLDSAVMIRFIEKTENGFVYKSGGGITAFSNLEDEYQEMLKKIYVPVNRKH
ncbi:MAG: aminodeoxychorismate synthase component I [Bacteroidales bacterium]|nr:aminodeoxychorismate synthase component I [Bacteroidales bacterium]